MDYDFDEIFDRKKYDSEKWNVKEGEIPLWVADMDFAAAPAVQDAILRRVSHPVYGYTTIPEEWETSYRAWWKNRHGLDMKRGSLMFCQGVVPAISSAVRRLTQPAERVVLLTPVYNIFFNSVVNNGRIVSECPLVYDRANGEYSIDFDALDRKLSDPQATLMILCNPHNPVGRIWSRDELREIGRLCALRHVTVISDEIHCDITRPGARYTPFAAVSDECAAITCISPTKAFNVPGIRTAAIYAPDEALYNRIKRGINNDEIAEPDALSCPVAVSAFSDAGEDWLCAVNAYVQRNKDFAAQYIADAMPELKVTPSDATYLMWVNIEGATDEDSRVFCARLRAATGVFVSNGSQYGTGGEHFIRVNVACPKSILGEALDRIKDFLGAGVSVL